MIIDRKFDNNLDLYNKYAKSFYLFNKVLKQEKNTPNKIYSLHELDAYAINKGKDHKGYEFGTKASIVTTKTTSIIVGVAAHKTNVHDSKTLDEVLSNTVKIVGENIITEAICDRGYRGTKEVTVNNNAITISIPDSKRKKDTKKEIQIKREKFKRRASIEPIIGHLKSDYRMARNYLKGFVGDQINLLLAAIAFNLKKWMNIYFYALLIQNFTLLLQSIQEIQRLKSLYVKLLFLKLYF